MSGGFTSKCGFSVVRPHQHQQSVLDGRKKSVLLRLVETVNLVEKQDGSDAALAQTMASLGDDLPHILHRCRDRGQFLEHFLGLRRDQSCERCLSGPGRTPQDHR